jgi:hypothetical protein
MSDNKNKHIITKFDYSQEYERMELAQFSKLDKGDDDKKKKDKVRI